MPSIDCMGARTDRKTPEKVTEDPILDTLRNLASPGLAEKGYRLLVPLGTGANSEVFEGVHVLSGCSVALKLLRRQGSSLKPDAERSALSSVDHPGIIKLLDVVYGPGCQCLIMEYAPKGTLLDHVRKQKRLPEPEAARILASVADALMHCHNRQIVHRDVKLENVVLDANWQSKLADFGFASRCTPEQKLSEFCGSPSYAAPEICRRKEYLGAGVDVWSLGVVLYAMLCGFLPFSSSTKSRSEICEKIIKGEYQTPLHLSAKAAHLIGRMLTIDPSKRITMKEVLRHPWVTQHVGSDKPIAGAYRLRFSKSSGDVDVDQGALLLTCQHWACSVQEGLSALLEGARNHVTATYYLLENMRKGVSVGGSFTLR